MTNDPVLVGLLAAIVGMSLLLLLFASAMLGRKLSDIEYQRAAGTNGVARIQAVINARTHANRVLLALTFLIVSVLGFVDFLPVIEIWVARALVLVMLGVFTASSMLDWRDEKRQVTMLLGEQQAAVEAHRVEHAAPEATSAREGA
jgi:hypothetical protein